MLKGPIFLFVTLLLIFNNALAFTSKNEKLKILHLTFHRGCEREFEEIADELSLDLKTWNIHNLPNYFFDPKATGTNLYNIGHDRAKRIWDKHKDYFNQFDVIITSDTAPLSRVFLQNDFKKHLIIWISNRFDFSDKSFLDCEFPDKEYYDLINGAKNKKNVTIIGSCKFEHFYAKSKGVDTGDFVINPCSPCIEKSENKIIPENIDKSKCFFVKSYMNETHFMNMRMFLNKINIKNYAGNFSGPDELRGFRGIIHLPYSWSTIALFVNTQMNLIYFIPTKTFLKKLYKLGNYWHQNEELLLNHLYLSEWYADEKKDCIVYFDSWSDLRHKIKTLDYDFYKRKVKLFARKHRSEMLNRWKKVFDQIHYFQK